MRLGIEVGETTVTAVMESGGRVQPLLFDGVPRLPAGVFVAEDGGLLTGRQALQAAAITPDRYLARPAGRLTADSVSVAGTELRPVDLVAATLKTVTAVAEQTARRAIPEIVMTIPAGWGPRRRTALRLAAHHAGLPEPTLVDSAKAVAQQLTSQNPATAVTDGALVLVYRLVDSLLEVALLRRQGDDWHNEATLGDDIPDLAPSDAITRTLALVREGLIAIEAAAADVAVVCCQVPLAQVAAVNTGLHDLGITAPVLSGSELDAAYGALRLVAAEPVSLRSRASAISRAAAVVLPIGAAATMLWLKLHSGRYSVDSGDVPPLSYIRPPYMYTIRPGWSLVPMLVLLGGVALVLGRAAARATGSMPAPDQRRRLARALRNTIYLSLAVAIAASVLGAGTYPLTPIWFFLAWMTPAAILGALVAGYSVAIERGNTSIAQWRQRLTFPLTPTVLAIAGVLAIEGYLETNTSLFASLTYGSGLPDWTIRVGSGLVALGVITLATRRPIPRVIAGTAAMVVLFIAYEYNVVATVVGAYVVAVLLWWTLRIRPARALAALGQLANPPTEPPLPASNA